MSGIEDRVLALGGLLQALAQVRRIADTGQSETTPVRVALDSVFRIDASDTEAVYGDVASLRGGLRPVTQAHRRGQRAELLGVDRRERAVVGEVRRDLAGAPIGIIIEHIVLLAIVTASLTMLVSSLRRRRSKPAAADATDRRSSAPQPPVPSSEPG